MTVRITVARTGAGTVQYRYTGKHRKPEQHKYRYWYDPPSIIVTLSRYILPGLSDSSLFVPIKNRPKDIGFDQCFGSIFISALKR